MEILVVEGNLVEVPTEDGLGYYPDLEVIAIDDNGKTFISPRFFEASEDAQYEAKDYAKTAKVDDTWREMVKPMFSYSQGNDEPYDDEERHRKGIL